MFSQLKVKREKNDLAQQGIEHMIRGNDERENSEKLCLQLDEKGNM